MPNFICDYTTQEEIKKLKEENEKLKEHLNKSREVSNRLIAENNTTMPSQSALYRENKKLKEENKNVIRVLNLVRKDKEQLKEENKELKSNAKDNQRYWSCIMDSLHNPDNPNKGYIAQWCEWNEVSDEDKIELFNAFGFYEEEETEEEEVKTCRECKEHQKETDIEHQRYLETAEKYSDKLWQICQELDIENHDTSENIIEEIKKLKEKLDGVKDILQTETLASGIQNRFYEILNDEETE